MRVLNLTFVDGNDRSNATGSVMSTYRGALTYRSLIFNRPYSTSRQYYAGIGIRVAKDGLYAFSSQSFMDMYGYLYRSPFNAASVYSNLLTYDDDSGGSLQFYFQYFLRTGTSYVLVATTYGTGVTGSFTIQANGPSTVTYS